MIDIFLRGSVAADSPTISACVNSSDQAQFLAN